MQFRMIAATLAMLAVTAMSGVAMAQEATSEQGNAPLLAQTTVRTSPRPSLTDDQLLKLRALKDQFSVDTASKRAQLKVLKHQLFDKMSEPSVNKSEVLALNSQINALKADLSNSRINFMLAAGDVFTPEQKAAFRSRMLHRGEWGGGRHGGGRGFQGRGGHGGFSGHGGPGGSCKGGEGCAPGKTGLAPTAGVTKST